MKKAFKIILLIIIVMQILLFVLPVILKSTINNSVKEKLNEKIDANIAWSDLSVNTFRNYPNYCFTIDSLSVFGKNKFNGDTLLYINNLKFKINPFCLIFGDLNIKSIDVSDSKINAIALSDSIYNWDIIKKNTKKSNTVGSSSSFDYSINKLSVINAKVFYSDLSSNTKLVVNHINTEISLEENSDNKVLNINSFLDKINFTQNNITYVNNLNTNVKTTLNSDLNSKKLWVKDGVITINNVDFSLDGDVEKLNTGYYNTNVNINSDKINLTSFLYFISQSYNKYLKGVKTEGEGVFSASINGMLGKDKVPAFNAKLKIENGKLKYDNISDSVDSINVDIVANNKGGSFDNTTIDVNKIHFNIDKKPFDANLHIKKLMSNAKFKGKIKGIIDLSSIQKIVAFDSLKISGIIDADMFFNGDKQMIENEEFDKINTSGFLKISDLSYYEYGMPEFYIDKSYLGLTPQMLNLKEFKGRVGNCDFNLSGNLRNYWQYLFTNKTLSGTLNHYSDMLDLNTLFALNKVKTNKNNENKSTKAIVIPNNLDIKFNSDIKNIKYDKLLMNNTKGKLTIRDGKMTLNGIRTYLLGGNMNIKGEYNTQNHLKPFVNFNFKATNIDVNEAANSFSVVDSLLPVAKNANGIVSANVNFHSNIKNNMKVDIPTITGDGNLKSKSITISNTKVLNGIAKIIKNNKYKKLTAQDINIVFEMKNGKIIIPPFNTKVFGSIIKVKGEQGFDHSLNYRVTAPISKTDVSNIAALFGGNTGAAREIPVTIIIKGTSEHPLISLDLEEARKHIGKDIEKGAKKLLENIMKDKKLKDAIENFFK